VRHSRTIGSLEKDAAAPGTHSAKMDGMQRRSAFTLSLVAAAAILVRTVAACSTNGSAGSPDAGEDASAADTSETSDAGDGGGGPPLCNAGCLCFAEDACPPGCYIEQSFEPDGAAMPLYCGNGIAICGREVAAWSFGSPMNNCGVGTPTYIDGGPDGAFCCAMEPVAATDGGDAAADAGDAGSCTIYTGNCTGALDASACPSTHAAAVTQCQADAGLLATPSAFAKCGGLDAVVYGGDTHWGLCLYDDAGTLVGSQGESDTNEFCNNTDYLINSGNVPCECRYPWVRGIQGGDVEAGSCTSAGGGSQDAKPE
jgi:hypothetical protein